ncbi:MAG: arginine deiminase-related protein [Ginsengibacter sp.]
MQTTSNILLIKPTGFSFNVQTAVSNAFQNKPDVSKEILKQNAFDEFDAFVNTLQSKGVSVTVIADTELPQKPDAVFPNNWISFHADGSVILYPMCAPNRRTERRAEIIETIKKSFSVNSIIDLSFYENENRFLEGTGSVVFDHQNKIAYACLSPRTDKELLKELCSILNYEPIYFYALDESGKEIYHTNVMMCVAEEFAVICLIAIKNKTEKDKVVSSLEQTGHEIIDISFEQMKNFAGNMLALRNHQNEKLLALSQSAFDSLSADQKMRIGKYAEMIPLAIKTIETIGGGSARCMIAEIFLPKKNK